MRSFFCAIGFVVLTAATAAAQLLDARPAAKPAEKPVPGRAAAEANRADNPPRPPVAGDAAAPQPNAMFAALDVDGDGIISKAELRKAFKALKTLDSDNDGSITLAEASVGGAPIGPGGPAGPLGDDAQIAQIMANDKNGDGKLTPNEVPREMVPMLQGVDQNVDGEITREELVVAMANMRNQFGGPAGPWRGGPGVDRNAEQATGQFLLYDKNGDGRLTQNELPQQATRMLQGADRNNDGAIDAGELQAALAQQGGRARALRGGVDLDDARGRGADVRSRRPADGKN